MSNERNQMIKYYQTELIQTKRLILKKGTVNDYLAVYEYDFTKLRDIDGEFEYVKQDMEQFEKIFEPNIEQFHAKNEAEHSFAWIIFLQDNMISIGEILADRENIDNNETEISFNLHPDYWGRGYMPESIEAVLNYLFDLGYENIAASYSAGNLKSKRVLKKSGFEYHEVIKNAWTKNGRPIDDYRYIITKNSRGYKKLTNDI
jgi:ribosomal-protein-alanine N-acetyltransferase